MELHEVLLEMMDRGFSISQGTTGFTLTKTPTDSDPRKSIGGSPVDHQVAGFENKGLAIEHYVSIKDIDFDPKPKIDWSVLVRFNIGLGPQILEMNSVYASDYGQAMDLAKAQADATWAKDPEKRKHGYIEIRIRPKGF
jgi:hypothetical protein